MITQLAIYVVVILGNEHPLVDALNAFKFSFIALKQNLYSMIAEEPLLSSLLVKRVSMPVSNWFKRQLQQLMFHPVPVLTEVFDAIESEEPWRLDILPSFLSALGLSSIDLVVPRVPSVPRAPATYQCATGQCRFLEH